ncbi:MAG: PepSY-like domain-containing protein [Muribaculaceae bacterium]|nr:PepSY-like domain-containing protein [Muribaculaceae bacterium]
MEFNNSGAWTSVDCKTKAVPEKLIIKPIRRYLNDNFSGQTVVKIEKKATAFEVELADGVEIKFDRLGNFKSIDMD